ncbi:biotin transporter BioY [Phototrophicus methaneseepsis]|uniref:Biotin transporter n=1 Tax=Phototrophicus methaneseepsis TaxID=2710758 RepID=A0A7S8IE29_9CHLR|nr:biotin transporter BioY [Phototrophicus methaneseepsis]QPC82171.1 biotin transporter BioY [Phototrophicus methaneseepsis]
MMLQTLSLNRNEMKLQRLAGIALFTVLMVLSAKVEIWFGSPVPFTLQVMVALLAGLVLGAWDGALSILAYLGLIVANLPVDAAGIGAAAFGGPTAGYLIGFVPGAFVAGWLVEHAAERTWLRWLAAFAGVAAIYAVGLPTLKMITGGTWSQAWEWGAYPFLGLDLLKAMIATLLVASWHRYRQIR